MLLQNWYPYKIAQNNNSATCHWLDFSNIPFSDPFFHETIQVAKSHNPDLARFKSLSQPEVLPIWAEAQSPIAPSAFIFHFSRCGSTLLSQVLGMDERMISLAEVPFFDDILRLPFKEARYKKEVPELLKAAISLYGRKRIGTEEHLIIKTDSWHIFFLKQFRECFPNVPFILLYRHPQEVIRSHQKLRGLQAVPNLIEPEVFGFSKETIANLSLDEYIAKVLEQYGHAYLKTLQEDNNTLLLNYSEGPATLLQKTLEHSHIEVSEEILYAMLDRTKFHSKYPGKLFQDEQETDDIPDYMRNAVNLYNKVEEIRLIKKEQ